MFSRERVRSRQSVVVDTARLAPELRRAALDLFEGNFPYALVLLDPQFRVMWTSSGFTTLLGYPESIALGSNVLDIVHPEDLDRLLPMATQMVDVAAATMTTPSVSGVVELPARVRSAAGAWLPMAISGRLFDDEGSLLVSLRLAVDRHALDAVLDCLGGGADIDATAARLVDLLIAQFGTASAWLVHDSAGSAAIVGPSQATGVGDPTELMSGLRGAGPSADLQWTSDRWIIPVLSMTGESLVAVFVIDSSSIGEPNPYDRHVLTRTANLASLAFTKADAERTLRLAAATDYLTSVLNRRELESRAMRLAVAPEGLPATLLYIDVDDFKTINDSYGHETGDAVLRTIARRLVGAVRSHDSVGRLGGDEFAVLCPALGAADRDDMRNRIAEVIAAPISVDAIDHALLVSASVGSATADHEDELITLIQRADAAMYQRKQIRQEPNAITPGRRASAAARPGAVAER